MSTPLSRRRLAENEAYFRQKNRAIEQEFDKLRDMAAEDGQAALLQDDDMQLHFFCECSDEKCRSRILLKRSQYDKIHKANDEFVIIDGHEVTEVEKVIKKTANYCIVKKNIDPPASPAKLNPTSLNNT